MQFNPPGDAELDGLIEYYTVFRDDGHMVGFVDYAPVSKIWMFNGDPDKRLEYKEMWEITNFIFERNLETKEAHGET